MTRILGLLIFLGVSAVSAQTSAVVSLQDAVRADEAWGHFHAHYEGESFGTKDLLAGVAVIRPGDQIHPPHRHAEEEFLIVTEGSGTWHLNGREWEASAGDMLYAFPWDVHGITNTGADSLTFVVWKWNSAGLPVPGDPIAESTNAEDEIREAIDKMSAATAPGGGGADAYAQLLADDFNRWTLGAEGTATKESWVEGVRSWFDDGWRVADRETYSMTVDIRGDLAFVRRVVSETFQGPGGDRSDPAKAAVSEVWMETALGWKLLRVEVTVLPARQ